ncbi:MAG: transporter substrate-binding domain-containing protein [Desulfobacteraceae bacterium]|nr:transporter substrate-binding domain-containing protein [Desulfobacteraceae bacterium]
MAGIILIFPVISSAETIRMAYIEAPPYYSSNKDGKAEGLVIDIMNKVMKKAGYDWEAASYPVKRMTSMLTSGEIHLWVGLSTLPEFQGTAIIGGTEIGKVILNAYHIGDKPPIMKKEDLAGKSLIILGGYSYGGWLSYIKDPVNKIAYHEPNSHESAFSMLSLGRAEYLLDYDTPAKRVLGAMNIPNLKVNEVSSFTLKFVVSRKSPDAQNMLNRLEKTYQELLQEGKN